MSRDGECSVRFPQTPCCVPIGIGRHDLAEIHTVEVSRGVRIVEDRLDQRLGGHIVRVGGATLVVHHALGDDPGPTRNRP